MTKNFESHIHGEVPVVVDFFADWCGPCKMMTPVLKEVKHIVGNSATVLKMDIEKNRFYAEKFNIHSLPTLLIFKNGKIIWRKTGVPSAIEIVENIANHS